MQKPRNNARDILMDNTKKEKNKIFLLKWSTDDVIGLTHRLWPHKSKIQTQYLLLNERVPTE